MIAHLVVMDGIVIGCWTSGVDAHEQHKRFPGSTVQRMRMNSGKEPCQHEYVDDNNRFEGERSTSTCTKCGDVVY
eukprot:COSAG01_NODE_48053_length_384_cov_1.189474_1_plen_74_part_01